MDFILRNLSRGSILIWIAFLTVWLCCWNLNFYFGGFWFFVFLVCIGVFLRFRFDSWGLFFTWPLLGPHNSYFAKPAGGLYAFKLLNISIIFSSGQLLFSFTGDLVITVEYRRWLPVRLVYWRSLYKFVHLWNLPARQKNFTGKYGRYFLALLACPHIAVLVLCPSILDICGHAPHT